MTTLLILLSLCSLIFSDSLSRFESHVENLESIAFLDYNIESERVVHKVQIFGRKTNPPDSLFNGTPKSCADQCLQTRFFCHSFMVVDVYGELQCIMSTDPAGSNRYFTIYLHGHLAQIIAEFDIKEKIDNVATILKNPTLLSNRRFDELLQGYGFSNSLNQTKWANMKTFLAACVGALSIPNSNRVNFNEWLKGIESRYEEHSRSGSTSKYTPSYEPSQKRRKTVVTPESNFLADLDLFIRGVNRNVETIYDPGKGTRPVDSPSILYIHSLDLQLLIILFNDNNYTWALSGTLTVDGTTDGVYLGASEGVNPQDIPRKSVIDSLVNAAARFGHDINRQLIEYHNGDSDFWLSISRLTGHDLNLSSENEKLILQDLSKIVPILHHKSQALFTKQNGYSYPFKDVQVFTFEK